MSRVLVTFTLGNVAVASLGYLQILLLIGLLGPTSIFYNQIKKSTGHGQRVTDSAPNTVDAEPASSP